jgi:hypothetical protein
MTHLKVYEILTHHANRIGCDPRTLSKMANRGIAQAFGALSDGTLIFLPEAAAANRQRIIDYGFRIRTINDRD